MTISTSQPALRPAGRALSPTCEVLRRAIQGVGVKRIAQVLKVSCALIYKWIEHRPDLPGADGSGAMNPLDRIIDIVRETGDVTILQRACSEFGYTAVKCASVPFTHASLNSANSHGHVKLVRVMEVAAKAAENGRIDPGEPELLRAVWDDADGFWESHVSAAERGHFAEGGGR